MEYNEQAFKEKANLKAMKVWLALIAIMTLSYGSDLSKGIYTATQYVVFLVMAWVPFAIGLLTLKPVSYTHLENAGGDDRWIKGAEPCANAAAAQLLRAVQLVLPRVSVAVFSYHRGLLQPQYLSGRRVSYAGAGAAAADSGTSGKISDRIPGGRL